jgi:hypothetical protein
VKRRRTRLEIVDGSGWQVRRFIDDAGPLSCAILER